MSDTNNIATQLAIINSVFLFAQLIVVALGAYIALRQYNSTIRAKKQEKAASVMRIYAQGLIYKVSLIKSVFDNKEEINAIANKISNDKPLGFASYELVKYGVTDRDVAKYKRFIRQSQLKDLTIEVGGQKRHYIDIMPKSIADDLPESHTLGQFIISTLNDLEYLCMEIESGAVDDTYIYGSLHQSLLPFIHKVAITIQATNNRSLPDENFYPYVTKLYSRWVARQGENYDAMAEELKEKAEKKPV